MMKTALVSLVAMSEQFWIFVCREYATQEVGLVMGILDEDVAHILGLLEHN